MRLWRKVDRHRQPCQRKGCDVVDPEGGHYGPPLMSLRARWYCDKHGRAAWVRWLKRRRQRGEYGTSNA